MAKDNKPVTPNPSPLAQYHEYAAPPQARADSRFGSSVPYLGFCSGHPDASDAEALKSAGITAPTPYVKLATGELVAYPNARFILCDAYASYARFNKTGDMLDAVTQDEFEKLDKEDRDKRQLRRDVISQVILIDVPNQPGRFLPSRTIWRSTKAPAVDAAISAAVVAGTPEWLARGPEYDATKIIPIPGWRFSVSISQQHKTNCENPYYLAAGRVRPLELDLATALSESLKSSEFADLMREARAAFLFSKEERIKAIDEFARTPRRK